MPPSCPEISTTSAKAWQRRRYRAADTGAGDEFHADFCPQIHLPEVVDEGRTDRDQIRSNPSDATCLMAGFFSCCRWVPALELVTANACSHMATAKATRPPEVALNGDGRG